MNIYLKPTLSFPVPFSVQYNFLGHSADVHNALLSQKTLHDFCSRNDIYQYNIRRKDIPQHKLDKLFFKIYCLQFFNKLSESHLAEDLNIFKTSVFRRQLANLFYNTLLMSFLKPLCVQNLRNKPLINYLHGPSLFLNIYSLLFFFMLIYL